MKEVEITLVKEWRIKAGVRIPEGTHMFVDPNIEIQLEKAGVAENRKRTVKNKNKE